MPSRKTCVNGSSTKIQAQTPWLPKMEETRFKVVHVPVCFCGLFFKCAMNADFEMTLLMVSSPLIWAKLTFVALTNHESFRDTTGYVTVNTSRQQSTIDFSLSIQSYSSVVPSNLILRIRLPQSHCYYTLHIHPNSSNIRCSIDRHSLPRHNRWQSTTNSTLKPLALRGPFVFRSSIHPLHRHFSVQGPTRSTVPGDSRETGRSPLVNFRNISSGSRAFSISVKQLRAV